PTVSACSVAGYDSPILQTVNGGSTWTQAPRVPGLFRMSCASATYCVAVGFNGASIVTQGGPSWGSQTLNGGVSLFGVSCPTTSVCVAVGAAGTVVASGNSGSTWAAQSSGTTQALIGIS